MSFTLRGTAGEFVYVDVRGGAVMVMDPRTGWVELPDAKHAAAHAAARLKRGDVRVGRPTREACMAARATYRAILAAW